MWPLFDLRFLVAREESLDGPAQKVWLQLRQRFVAPKGNLELQEWHFQMKGAGRLGGEGGETGNEVGKKEAAMGESGEAGVIVMGGGIIDAIVESG